MFFKNQGMSTMFRAIRRPRSSPLKVTVYFKGSRRRKGNQEDLLASSGIEQTQLDFEINWVRGRRTTQRARHGSSNGPTYRFQPQASKSNPHPPNPKSNTNNIQLTLDPYYPSPQGTQTSPDLAKIGHLTSFTLKNDVKCFIIGKIMSFSTTVLLRLHPARPNKNKLHPNNLELILLNKTLQSTKFKPLGTYFNKIWAIPTHKTQFKAITQHQATPTHLLYLVSTTNLKYDVRKTNLYAEIRIWIARQKSSPIPSTNSHKKCM